LNSTTPWDLIIVGEESNLAVDGPIVKQLVERVNNNTPVIYETGNYSTIMAAVSRRLCSCAGSNSRRNGEIPNRFPCWRSPPVLNTPNKISMLGVYKDLNYKHSGDSVSVAPEATPPCWQGYIPTEKMNTAALQSARTR